MEPSLEYYAYLASTVAPGELAKAAARKLVQRAVQVLGRPAPGGAELFEVFCAHDAKDLALKLAAPRASACWADATRRERVVPAARQLAGMRQRALGRAEAAWRREFDVFGRRVAFGRGRRVDWQLDALHGASFAGAASAQGLDPKAPWLLARMEHLVWLGQGVWLSPADADRARYAHEFTQQVRHFARENPPGVGVHWLSPMEVALRAANLCLAFLMMRHRPELQDPEFAVAFAGLLATHGLFVERHLENTSAVPNNHYVADLVGLLHLGVLFPELPNARAWRERAVDGLREQIRRQVLADGFTFEGSTSYHRLATELFTLGLFAGQAGRLDLGEEYRQRLHGMFRAVAAYLTPSGTAPQIGDNDSGQALPLVRREPLEHAYLLPLGAVLFEDPELRLEGAALCEEAAWLLGADALARWEVLPESQCRTSRGLPQAGLYFLRSGSAYAAASCGSTGQAGLGGHGHCDKLSIELHSGGEAVVVDPGTYCYTSEPAERDRFRSTAAHSTIQVDGVEQCRLIAGRPFALPDDARARALGFESTPGRERFVGEHRGFERLVPGLRHQRELVLDRAARAFLVLDRLAGSGCHEVVSRFLLPDTLVRFREPSQVELDRIARFGLVPARRALELGTPEAPRALLVPPEGLEVALVPSWYSPGYGRRTPAITVELRAVGELPVEQRVVILLLAGNGSETGRAMS
ncbi:MAG: alginate lyase family protein [Myxococcales bacterium]